MIQSLSRSFGLKTDSLCTSCVQLPASTQICSLQPENAFCPHRGAGVEALQGLLLNDAVMLPDYL